MEAKHTPGPWSIGHDEDETPTIWDSTGRLIARLRKVDGFDMRDGSPSTPETQAKNACLIAAVPELLEALLAIRNEAATSDLSPKFWYAWDQVHSAIAKATGTES